jgi:nucleotide-binding universal stress UspA family protein
MQFVFVLAMVFLGGGLMEFVGMEGILGAFLAGLVLNRLIPHVSPLMNRLEFVGNALFIPYFLIGVGMIIDVRSLFTGGEALKVAVVMTVVATFSKWLAAWITQKIYRMQPNERSMIFGLSNAQAAATLAAVLIGHEIIMENGERLLNDDVLNGTVVMILFTCVISSLVTERSARRFAMNEELQSEEQGAKKSTEQILIPVANPDTIEDLINLALVIKDAKQKNGLIALNVINDSNSSEKKELQGKRNLEKAAMIAAAADVPVNMVSRYDLNIASGIIHTIKEYEATDVVIGLHRKANIVDTFFGNLAESLLKGTHREVMIAKFLMPVNTLRRINIAVPPKAEYETGFSKWVEHFCRMGSILGCRVHFFSNERTLMRLQQLVKKKYAGMAVTAVFGALLAGECVFTVDPVTRGLFLKLDTGNTTLCFTGKVSDINSIYYGDYLIYNTQYTYIDKAYDKVLADVDYHPDTTDIYIPDSNGSFICGNLPFYYLNWDEKTKKRVFYENENTQEMEFYNEVKYFSSKMVSEGKDKAVLIVNPYMINVHEEEHLAKLAPYYEIGERKEVKLLQGSIVYYELTRK